jgi:hypothetical protein
MIRHWDRSIFIGIDPVHGSTVFIDFLKMEKVELPPFEKARLNGPETAQN